MPEITRNSYELVPTTQSHANVTFVAEGCGDLNVTRTKDGLLSVWRCPSLFQRLKFLFQNKLSLHIMGTGQPPVSLCVGDMIDMKDGK